MYYECIYEMVMSLTEQKSAENKIKMSKASKTNKANKTSKAKKTSEAR